MQTKVLKAEGPYWVCLDGKNWERLATNMSDILSYVQQQNAVIAYYQKCLGMAEKPQ